MKKWKVLLVMLCAMLVSIGLFACKQEESAQDLTNITWRGSDYTYTDNDTWATILSDLQKNTQLSARTAAGETVGIGGADCDFTSSIEFDGDGHCKIGSYTVTVQPKENNPKKLSRSKNVEITHAFPANSTAEKDVCGYCGATRTKSEENSIIHYGAFHKGTSETVIPAVYGEDGTNGKVFTNQKEGTSYIKDFGTAEVNGKTVTVPTLTVGKLEPGMTITVKGSAQTTWSTWGVAENAYYYFPVIGIADKYLNDPEWQGSKTDTATYAGGTSVFVRGEGWVLYNGIGEIGNEKTRALGALSSYLSGGIIDGKGEARNYGSHELASLGKDEIRPSSFTPGQVPAVGDWENWVVYSKGTTKNSGDAYIEKTDIELTWNYRQDGVIELIYNVDGSKLVCMIKVPDSAMGYYDTILHGDYVDMWIDSYEVIETRTPKDFFIDVKNDNYYEGQMFNPSTVSAQFTYEQSGDQKFPQSLTREHIYATEATSLEGEVEWVSMATNPVEAKYNFYKVEIIKGNRTFSETFEASRITVVGNIIEFVSGADVNKFYNYNTVGELALETNGTNIVLKPKGTVYAQAITDELAAAFASGATAETYKDCKYVALKIEAKSALGETITAKSGETSVPVYYDKTNGYLVLALTENAKTVTVTGLQNTPTVFDFGTALGFGVASTIEKDITGSGWYLNNTANTVKVTFKAEAGKTITRVTVGKRDETPAKWVEKTNGKDYPFNGITVKQGATYEDGVLSMEIVFPAAALASYEARKINVSVDGLVDFEYKIDYRPQIDGESDTVDGGYYTFVSDGKIYFAKAANNADHVLGLNVNAGDGSIALLDLAYTYNATTGSASLKNAKGLTGVEIKVVKVAGEDIVLLEVDPSKNGIEGGAYGYQIKTEDYSGYYFAVSENNAVRTAVSTGNSVILSEGSCLEKGLSGFMNKSGEVSFIANPVEFAGDHRLNGTQTGAECVFCGEVLDRNKSWKSYTLHDNEFVEMWGSFTIGSVTLKSDKGEDAMWSGLYVKLGVGSNTYRLRNDGAIMDFAPNTEVNDSTITSSLDENGGARTPLGRLDADGNAITEAKYLDTLNKGASFRVWLGYQDNTLTAVWRIFKKDDSRVYYEFTHKFADISESALSVTYALDGATVGEGGSKGNANFLNGKIDKSMIASVENKVDGGNLTLQAGNIENHLATVTATGGNATSITDEVKTALGLAATDTTYTKYVSFDVKLEKAYSKDGAAYAEIYADSAYKTLREGAVATFNSAKDTITVTVAFAANEVPGVYYLDLKDDKGSTMQADIKLDLSAVSMYAITGTVGNNATVVKGGTVTIAYDNLGDIDLANVRISFNDTERALNTTGAEMDFGNGHKATWTTGTGNTGTLTLTVPKIAELTGVPEYTVLLIDGEKTAVTSRFTLNLPGTDDAGENIFCKEENVFGLADGNTMYIYLFGDKSTSVDYLEFSANNANTIATAKEKILAYSLAHSLNGNNVSFALSNDFTKNVTASHFESGAFKVTQIKIDLSYLAIEENAAYYFYLNTSKTESAGYFTVAETNRTVEKADAETGEKVAVVPNSCTQIGSEGYAIQIDNSVVGYYGLKALPSHTWGTNASDATLFECTECGAILKNGNAKGTLIPAAQFGAEKFNGAEGFTISYFQNSANSDWDSLVARTKYGQVNICSPNLQTNVMTSVTGEMNTLKTLLNGENVFPSTAGAIAESGFAWDTIKNTTNCYITVTVKQDVGIVYYMNDNKVLTYPADMTFGASSGTVNDFIKLFMLCAAEEGLYVATTQFAGTIDAVDALVQKGALTDAEVTARYQLYLQEKDLLKELEAHVHEYKDSDHKCNCGALDPLYDYPVCNTENAFDVGVAAMNEEKTLVWVNYIQKGEKFVFTGTHKSNSENNWAAINVSLGSYKAVDSATIRADRWVDGGVSDQNDNGGKHVGENWTFTKSNGTFNDWGGVHATARKDGNVTITVDWKTDETKISVTIALEKDGTTTAFTYSFSATTGNLRDRYNFALGCGLSYASLKVTEAPTRNDAPTVAPQA